MNKTTVAGRASHTQEGLSWVVTPRVGDRHAPGIGYAFQGGLTGAGHHASVARGDHDDGGHGFRRANISCGRESRSPWNSLKYRRCEDWNVTRESCQAAPTGHPAPRDPAPALEGHSVWSWSINTCPAQEPREQRAPAASPHIVPIKGFRLSCIFQSAC